MKTKKDDLLNDPSADISAMAVSVGTVGERVKHHILVDYARGFESFYKIKNIQTIR